MSNLSKTQLSFDFLNYSHKQFSELFNGLSSRDKNSFRNSQSGTGLNEMFDFLCSVLGKKVVDEKKARKTRPKSSENRDEQTLTNQQNEQQAGNTQQTQVEPPKVEVSSKKVVKSKKPELSTEKVEPTQDKVELSNVNQTNVSQTNVSQTNVSQTNVSQSTPSNTKVAQSNDKKHVVKKSREHANVAPNNE